MPSQLVLPVIPNPPAGIPADVPAVRFRARRAVPHDRLRRRRRPNVHATGNGTDATVTWTPAVARAGDTDRRVPPDRAAGRRDTSTVPGSATSADFTDLAPGVHHFAVTVEFGTVARDGRGDGVERRDDHRRTAVEHHDDLDHDHDDVNHDNNEHDDNNHSALNRYRHHHNDRASLDVDNTGNSRRRASTTVAATPVTNGGSLPFTGGSSGRLGAIGVLMTVGGALFAARRRRRTLL